MKYKVFLVSTIVLVIVWFAIAFLNQDVRSNIIDNDSIPTQVNSPKTILESKLDVAKQNLAAPSKPEIKGEGYIVDCSEQEVANEKEFDDYYELTKAYFDSLSDSILKDKQRAYALFAKPPVGKARLDLLINYNQQHPGNPLILKEIIRACTASKDVEFCDSKVIENTIVSDKNNGATWLTLLFFNTTMGNDEGIIHSIREVVKSSYFDDGFITKIKLYSETLNDSDTNNKQLNLTIAMGEAALELPAYSTIVNWCKQNKNDTIKADACLQLGRYMDENSKMVIDQMIGIALQKLIFEAQEKTLSFEKTDLKQKEIMENLSREQTRKASSLVAFDEKLLWSWFNNFENYGEYIASKKLVEEAIERSKDENYFPCESKS